MDADVRSFYDWLDDQDIKLAEWDYVPDGPDGQHHHALVPLDKEETNAILERYLRERGSE